MTMPAIVPKTERTPTAWRRACLELLKSAVHADYRGNRDAKGRSIEFVRTDENGLQLSYNFVRIRDEYHLGFAVLFDLETFPQLVTPFLSGSRFDHNRTIWRLFSEDFGQVRGQPGYPAGVWSHNLWRDNTLEQLAAGLPIPEQHLYPKYLAALRAGKQRLAAIFQRATEICDQFDERTVERPERIAQRAAALGLDLAPLALLETVQRCDAFRLAGGALAPQIGSKDLLDLTQVPIDAIVLANLQFFYPQRAQLLQYASVVDAL